MVQEADNLKLQVQPQIAPAIMPFDTENGEDLEGALANAIRSLSNFQFKYDDIHFYFTQVEIKMASAGVKKQWTKFSVLTSIIPEQVQNQVKTLLRKGEEAYTQNDSYKQLKDKIIKIFGPAEDAGFNRAMSRVLTTTPSALARELIDDLCDMS